MTTRDLYELASLDVLGLLDEQERAEFEEGFRAAPLHVQAQIRAEQVRASTSADDLLPRIEAPAGLRGRVIAAVREAIASVNHEPVGRIGPGSARAWSSAPLWRAACIGFGTAALLLGGATWHLSRVVQAITDTAASAQMSEALAATAGPKFVDMLARPTMKHVAFTPAAKDYDGKAAAGLYVDTQSRVAYLVCNSMPVTGGSYRLVIADASGTDIPVKEFSASAGTFFVPLEDFNIASLDRLQIRQPQADGSVPAPLLVASGA
jgi:hypothetical protein